LHVYPVLPPQVASGEILRLGVEDAPLDVRVVTVERVLNCVEEPLKGMVEVSDALDWLGLD
jgi:hypothetical protein